MDGSIGGIGKGQTIIVPEGTGSASAEKSERKADAFSLGEGIVSIIRTAGNGGSVPLPVLADLAGRYFQTLLVIAKNMGVSEETRRLAETRKKELEAKLRDLEQREEDFMKDLRETEEMFKDVVNENQEDGKWVLKA